MTGDSIDIVGRPRRAPRGAAASIYGYGPRRLVCVLWDRRFDVALDHGGLEQPQEGVSRSRMHRGGDVGVSCARVRQVRHARLTGYRVGSTGEVP